MDYIREELLRQRIAWSALLRGGQQSVETARQKQQEVYPAVGTEPETAELAAALRAAEVGRALSRQEAELVVQTLLRGQENLWQLPQEERMRQSESGAADGSRRSSGGGEVLRGQWSGTVAEAEKPERTNVRIVRPERSREQGAKELSRLIQQDSRRYDGGFALY